MAEPVFATCEHCKTQFAVKPSSGKARFCSRTCWRAFETANRIFVHCRHCGTPFPIQEHFATLKKGTGSYCSRQCYLDSRPTKPVRPFEERFWEKVEKSEGDGCWIWKFYKDRKGYGRINAPREWGKRHPLLASRVSYQMHYGPIPEGMQVLHRCDQPSCVRPDHLFIGTALDNMADCKAKGRRARGEKAPWAKLTDAQARQIREEYVERREPFAVIARRYGVSAGAVGDLLRGRRWGWLGGDLTVPTP